MTLDITYVLVSSLLLPHVLLMGFFCHFQPSKYLYVDVMVVIVDPMATIKNRLSVH